MSSLASPVLLVRDRQVATRQRQGEKSDLIRWQDEIKVFVQGIAAFQDSYSTPLKTAQHLVAFQRCIEATKI